MCRCNMTTASWQPITKYSLSTSNVNIYFYVLLKQSYLVELTMFHSSPNHMYSRGPQSPITKPAKKMQIGGQCGDDRKKGKDLSPNCLTNIISTRVVSQLALRNGNLPSLYNALHPPPQFHCATAGTTFRTLS